MNNIFKNNKESEGWKLISNNPLSITKDFEVYSFLEGEERIDGDTLLKRDKIKYGQEDAEWLLDNQELLKDYKDFYLIFLGTVWEGSDGRRRVAGLDFGGRQWCLRFSWLGYFDSDARLLRPRKSSDTKVLGSFGDLETRVLELEQKMDKISKFLVI